MMLLSYRKLRAFRGRQLPYVGETGSYYLVATIAVPVVALNLDTSVIVTIAEGSDGHSELLPLGVQCVLYVLCLIRHGVSETSNLYTSAVPMRHRQ